MTILGFQVLQFYEAGLQRMGCGIVGPCGCGKSTIWKICKDALARLKQEVVKFVINPKAMPRTQLLGRMDHDTREWYE